MWMLFRLSLLSYDVCLIVIGPFVAISPTQLLLENTTGKGRIAFKIQTTLPSKVLVRPNSGQISDGDVARIVSKFPH